MERRYVCGLCGMKWFDPLPGRLQGEPAPCGACGGSLLPLVGRAAPRGLGKPSRRDDIGNDDAQA